MRRIAFLIGAAMLWAAPAAALPDFNDVRFDHCYDGDTCWFILADGPNKFRLAGINAAEIGRKARCAREQKLAEAAKGYLEWHLKRAKRIDLVNIRQVKYGLMAPVLVDGKDLSVMALAKGRARPYHGGKRKGWCGTA